MNSVFDGAGATTLNTPLLIAAWTVLDAANDLRHYAAIESCRRVLDATYQGENPRPDDLEVVLDFFD